MLYAAFSTLMNFEDLEHFPNAKGLGKYGLELENCGVHRIRGWKFDYFRIDGAWNSESYPDITKDADDSIFALIIDFPPRIFNSICEHNGIYSGHYKFDYINVDSLGREALTIRLSRPSETGKPHFQTVMKIVDNALSCGVDIRYINEVIISKAKLDNKDATFFFNEDNYSPQADKSCEVIREWFLNNKKAT